MSEKILFQQDRLTVTDEKVIVGSATIFYPSISATSIYEGRPYLAAGITAIACMIPAGFMLLTFSRMFGPHFRVGGIALSLLPLIGLGILAITYKVKCLFIGIEGQSVAVLKSKDRFALEVAQRAIESAKRSAPMR